MEQTIEKRKPGRPKGRPLKLALEKTKEAVDGLNTVIETLTDKQRPIFLGLAQGFDPIRALLLAGNRHFEGIVRYVFTRDGHRIKSRMLTVDNLDELDYASITKLNRVAESIIRQLMNEKDISTFLPDIQNLFKLVAPDAFQTMTKLMMEGQKETTRLRAAQDILNRAGYSETEKAKNPMMPVQVNILFNETPVAEINPEISYAPDSTSE